MYYNTVQIRKSNTKEGWTIFHDELEGDRESGTGMCSGAMGFSHYPREWGKRKGFEALKKAMIEVRESTVELRKRDIDCLTRSINSLKSLQQKEEKV